MPISFGCPTCGRPLQVSDAAAGRSGRCPHCQAALVVPAATAEASTAVWTGEPAPESKSKAWIYAAAGAAALLLVGLVAGAVLLLTGGGGGGSAAATADAMLYLPDDCQMIVVVKVDEATNSKAYKDLQAVAKDAPGINALPGDIEKQAEKMGLAPSNIGQVTFGICLPKNLGDKPDFVLVVRTLAAVNADEIKAKLKDQKFTDVQAGAYAIYENQDPAKAVAVCIIDQTTLVGGPTADAVRKVLERKGKPKQGDNMQFALKQMGTPKTIGMAIALQDTLAKPEVQQLAQMNPQVAKHISNLDAAVVQVALGSDIDVNLTVHCKSADSAKEMESLVNGLLAIARLTAGQNMPKEALELLNALKIAADGPRIEGKLLLKTATLIQLSKQAPKGPLPF